MDEMPSVKQDGNGFKRWFRSAHFDLFTWQSPDGVFTSLQLCYDRGENEHVLRWDAGKGYWHEAVDLDESKPGRAMSALLRANGVFPRDLVLSRFLEEAAELPHNVVGFVEARLRELPLPPQPPAA